MRIVAGELKGRVIKGVKGNSTRPTSDKIKENIFNIIGPYFEGGTVLDLYGGSGNLAMESLSRGMDQAILVDRENAAVQTIRQNIQDLGLGERTEVYRNDAFKALKALAKREIVFDLVFLDPPYKGQKINDILAFLEEFGLLAEGGIVMAECLKEDPLLEACGSIVQFKREIYGITAVTFYRKEAGNHE